MKFSVLMSVYSGEQSSFFRRSLQSVFWQTLLPDEVVIVKDGALTLELDEVIEEFLTNYPNVMKVVELSQNMGTGYAQNIGLRYCNYDIVAKMDSDDISVYNRFAEQICVFEEHPEVDVVGAWVSEFEGDEQHIISVRKVPENQEEIKQFSQHRSPINNPVVMYRKKAVIDIGGYKPICYCEDYDLWVRMLMQGAIMYNIPKSLLLFRYSRQMMRRRGGLLYALREIKALSIFYQIGYFSLFLLVQNIIIRFSVRMMPLPMRSFVYKMFIRSTNKM